MDVARFSVATPNVLFYWPFGLLPELFCFVSPDLCFGSVLVNLVFKFVIVLGQPELYSSRFVDIPLPSGSYGLRKGE
jgi:hypothetical protein